MKTYKFKINKDEYKAKILEYKGDSIVVEVNNSTYHVEVEHEKVSTPKLVRSKKSPSTPSVKSAPQPVAGAGSVVAPIPGQIHSLLVKEGDTVEAGDPVLILEAMKMESEINSPQSGVVSKVVVKQGDNVQEGQVLMEIGE